MKDLRQKVRDERGFLKKMISYIPGYSGYYDREMRRDADKLLRTYLSQQYSMQKSKLDDIMLELVNSGRMKQVESIENLATRLQKVCDEIKFASYGYAGFFDAIRIQQDKIDRLYDADAALVDSVKEIATGIEALAQAVTDNAELSAPTQTLKDTLLAIDEQFQQRKNLIQE